MSRPIIRDKAFSEMNVRNLEAWWDNMRERPLPVPGGSHSLALLAYEMNRDRIGFEFTQENLPHYERVLFVSGGPGAKDPERVQAAIDDFKPDAVLAGMSYMKRSWHIYKELKIPFYVVDMEVDSYCLELHYPKGYSGEVIFNGCKMVSPIWCKPSRVYWCNCAEGSGSEAFNRDDLGPRIPMRTTGEVGFYIAAFKMKAAEIGLLGIQNDGERYVRQRKFTLDILARYEGKITDYEGSGVVHEWLGNPHVETDDHECGGCEFFLPTAPPHTRQGRCTSGKCDRGVRYGS